MNPEVEARLRKWIAENPRTEKVMIKELENKQLKYICFFVISIFLILSFLYYHDENWKFQKEMRKEVVMQKWLDKKKDTWVYEIIKESYK